ncbi:undecaprenyl-phosphate glucose phosphotransferase [Jiella sp. MQZ9-1]|uniref:Undecaprenyl-phosphate glucose phosphotransferase n=1 Tax=Jiella flava TaxID=2816857 RepID=A0A939JXT6_9HYPH|nr:undecaprenyl-phosphate glucose phosphotransferase [Jiella flava]MBO0664432.1 undecaprenyl-phosphate glucose phosphotransferase [Jiella flava]MCD2473068.1 undecaprenyl-phosphate glucose phosphotransferase [Jiella flava]
MSDPNESLPFSKPAARHLPKRPDDPNENVQLNAQALQTLTHLDNEFISPRMLCGLWRLGEGTVFFLIGIVCWLLEGQTPKAILPIAAMLVGTLIGIGILNAAHTYDLSFLRGSQLKLWRVAVGLGLAAGLVALFLYGFDRPTLSGLPLLSWAIIGLAVICLARLIFASRLRHWARNGLMERRAVIVGGGKNAETLIRGLEMQPGNDIRICGIFDDRDNRRSPPLVAGYPKLGTIAELVEFARRTRIDMLIVTLPLSAETRLLSLLKQLWVLPLDIRLAAHSAELKFRPRTYSYVGSLPLIDVIDRPLADWDTIAKRAFDIMAASLAIVLLSPIMLITAIAVKLDSPGPIIFRQKRHGFNNQEVEIFKFRSLHHAMSDPEARQIVTRNDKRVTRVGAFIRKTSIDELPQLFNVLRGDLSIVGPRPHAVHARSSRDETFTEIVDGYFGRHKVKPGITGWAQIHGWRGEIDDPTKLVKRFEYDLFYIENWSLALDLYILLMTPISLLRTDSAY